MYTCSQDTQNKIKEKIDGNARLAAIKSQLRLDMTRDGLRIQIMDEVKLPMLATGSAAPNERAVQLLRKVVPVLAKLPQPMLDAWSKELKAVLALPEVNRKLTELGLDVETSTSEEFHKRMMSDLARWKAIIDEIGYKPT